jgi:bifunctional non-homologous end joining protein LigD
VKRARASPPSREIAEAAPRKSHWVCPDLVAEVKFTEWTPGGRLRHPIFLGLRADKTGDEVVIDRSDTVAAPSEKIKTADPLPRALEGITHKAKVLYPDSGITRLDLARYYGSSSTC